MKLKQLLFGLMAFVGLTTQAADYVYTTNARYKIMGANQFTQGSVEDNLSGWQSASGRQLSEIADTFEVRETGGPDGGKYVAILNSGAGASIVNADIMIEAGQTYYVTYKVKGSAERQNFNLSGSNTQNFFVNADGSISTSATGYAAIAKAAYYYNDGWTQVSYAYTAPADGFLFLVMNFTNLLAEDGFADFAVYPVQQISDDRVLLRSLERSKLLLSMSELTQGKDDLQGIIGEIEEFAKTNESESDQADYMAGLEDETARFLAKNGVDVSPYFSHFTFDDLTPKGNASVSGWSTGSRWGTGSANANFSTVFASQQIGNAYELGYASLQQEQALPAGKYLYVVSAMGYDLTYKSDIVDYRTQIGGIKMFINADSLEFNDLPTWGPKNYAKVFTVNEGETVNIGVNNTAVCNSNMIQFDNHYLYLLDKTKEDVDNFVNAKKLADAKYALQFMTDSAKIIINKPQYIFGKDSLQVAIDASDKVYAEQNDPINSPAVLTAQMNDMRTAIRAYYTINSEVVTFKEDIDDCTALVANEKYTEGKPALQSALDAAVNYYNSIKPEVRDSAAIVAADNALCDARQTFYVANASYNNPGLVAIANPTFKEGPSSRTQAVPGWDDANIRRDSKSGWAASANTAFETGYALNYARNNSSCEGKYLAQDVKLDYAGVYSFSAEMLGYHSGGKNNANTGVYFFVGNEGLEGAKMDSTVVYTPDQIPTRYSINVIVNEPTTLRFGVDARNNKSCTRIYVSGCQVKYYGAYDKYQRDSVKAVAQPTIDSLAAEIAAAKELKETSRNKASFSTAVETFQSAIGHAEQVKGTEVASMEALQGILDEITALKEAELSFMLSGVWPAEGKYFDLTGSIKNADLSETVVDEQENEVFVDWTSEGNTAYKGEQGLMTYVFNAESNLQQMKVHQVISNMPAGTYQFMANATYKLESNGTDFPQDADMNGLIAKYNECQNYSVFANSASMVMKGVLTGCEEDKWEEIINSFDYRHHHPRTILDGTRFENYLDFNVKAEDNGTIDLGIQAENVSATQLIWAKNFRLLFWGDKVVSGITGATADAKVADTVKKYVKKGEIIIVKNGIEYSVTGIRK